MAEMLLKTRVFDVERRTYVRGAGKLVTRDVVVHPGAVVVLPLLDDGRIVMIHNYRYTAEQALLELPAGTREPGEPPETTAARELEEEAGYQAARVEPLLSFYTSPGILTEQMWAFVATELTATAQQLQRNEEISVELLTPVEVRRLLIDGRIRDGKSIAVLATYFLRLDGSAGAIENSASADGGRGR